MERHEILDLMSQLQLSGMRAAYDEIVTAGVKRSHGIERVIGQLLQAEIAAKQARSINYQMTLAKMPLVKELSELAFDGSPINGGLIEQLSDNLKGIRGRQLEQDRWSEEGFTLAGRDQDGSNFHVEMRKQGTKIRGYSLVYASRGTEAARRIIEHLRQNFEAFPKDVTVVDGPKPSGPEQIDERNAIEELSPQPGATTVQPNLGEIDKHAMIQFAPNGKYVAISNRSQIKLWEIASGRPLRILEHTAFFEQFTFIENGAQIMSVHKDGEARFWDPATGRLISSSKIEGIEPGYFIRAMSHRPNDKVIVLVVGSNQVVVWDYNTKRTIWDYKIEKTVDEFVFGKSQGWGDLAATLSRDSKVLIVARGPVVQWLDLATRGLIRTILLRNDLRVLPSGLIDEKILVAKTRDQDCDADLMLVTLAEAGPKYATLDLAPGCKKAPSGDESDAIRLVHNDAKGLLYIARRDTQVSKVLDLTVGLHESTAPP